MRLIDADALMKECAKFVAPSNNSDFAEVPTWNDAISLIGSAPTIEERKTGKDIYMEGKGHCEFKCSICGVEIGVVEGGELDGGRFRFCPNCGARMEDEP